MSRDVRGSVGISGQVLVPTINVEGVERVAWHMFQGCIDLHSISGNMTMCFILVS